MAEAAKGTAQPMSAADAIKLAQSAVQKGGSDFAEYDANGFLIMNDKNKLVGKGFTIVSTDYDVRETDRGGVERVHVFAVTDGGKAITFTDTSSGVFKQLGEYRGEFPVRVRKGLRASNYNTGNGPATTFYLDYDA